MIKYKAISKLDGNKISYDKKEWAEAAVKEGWIDGYEEYEWVEPQPDPEIEKKIADALAEQKALGMISPKMARKFVETAELSDEEMEVAGAGGLFDKWEAGISYDPGKRLVHDGKIYIVQQGHASQAHQPPGSDGMLAVYVPVGYADAPEQDGSLENPFDLIDGMAIEVGKYYRYNGAVWQLKRELGNVYATRFPGDAGMDDYWTLAEG